MFDLGATGWSWSARCRRASRGRSPRRRTFDDLADLLLPAVGVAVVGYTDNTLDGRAFANRNRYAIDANQELLALGGANVAAGLLQGFPV